MEISKVLHTEIWPKMHISHAFYRSHDAPKPSSSEESLNVFLTNFGEVLGHEIFHVSTNQANGVVYKNAL